MDGHYGPIILLILSLSLFPFVTSWVSQYPLSLAPQMLYGAVIFLTDFSYYLLGRALSRESQNNPTIRKLFQRYQKLTFYSFCQHCGIAPWLVDSSAFVISLDSLVLLLLGDSREESRTLPESIINENDCLISPSDNPFTCCSSSYLSNKTKIIQQRALLTAVTDSPSNALCWMIYYCLRVLCIS